MKPWTVIVWRRHVVLVAMVGLAGLLALGLPPLATSAALAALSGVYVGLQVDDLPIFGAVVD
jgi:hypothetical protein